MKNYYYIVDTSYLIFHSAYSAFNSYAEQFPFVSEMMAPDYDPTVDEEYQVALEHRFIECLENPIVGTVPLIDKSRFIFCMDCHRKDIWRREIFPEYKMNRDTRDNSKDKFNVSKAFEFARNIIIPKYCSRNNAKILKCPVAEGDDIVAVATKTILNQNENNAVIIISVDKDMLQLSNDRTTIIDCNCVHKLPKSELERALKEKVSGEVSASDFLLFKIMIGDKSDCIPNLKRGMGPKNAYKLMCDRESLKKLLSENSELKKSFERNKLLISFNKIPDAISSSIIEEMNEINLFGRKDVLGS